MSKQHFADVIEPFDVIGLTDRSRSHWYPSLVNDLFCNQAKLGATEQEITTRLRKCGLKWIDMRSSCRPRGPGILG
jgi:hypothetical protein